MTSTPPGMSDERWALDGLVAWIDAWRDLVDGGWATGEFEERWRVPFTDLTPELVQAREVLSQLTSTKG